MLYRKFASQIESHLLNHPNKILLVNGARQIGKSYLIRYVGKKLFRHFVEINLKEDKEGAGLFAHVRSMDDFHIQLGAMAGDNLGEKKHTLIFLDEIQSYPHLMTMLKFLGLRDRYIGSLFRVDEPVPDDSCWSGKTPDGKGAQVDLILESKAARTDYLCEMKFSAGKYLISANEADNMLHKIDAFANSNMHNKSRSIQLVIVAAMGLAQGYHASIANNVISIDDLFR